MYVGSPVEICFKLFACMQLNNCRPFGLTVREPQSGCLALKPPPTINLEPSDIKKKAYWTFLIACRGGQYMAEMDIGPWPSVTNILVA